MKTILLLLALTTGYNGLAQSSAEKAACKKTVEDFYKWYRVNWRKIDAFTLYKGKKKKDQPPYVINWKEAERYFSFIRKNVSWLGETFIKNEKAFFKQCQKEFDADPTGDLPYGFDYDRFVGGQEDPEYIVDSTILRRDNKWTFDIKGDKATVYITDSHWKELGPQKGKVELVKENGRWTIARCIETVE